VINGHTVIGGKAIAKFCQPDRVKCAVVLTKQNIDEVNRTLVGNFAFDFDSFRDLEPKGIRVMEAPLENIKALEGDAIAKNLVIGIKPDSDQAKFRSIYSLRDFVIWLQNNVSKVNLSELVCLDNETCAD
jgi:hypothetical protein